MSSPQSRGPLRVLHFASHEINVGDGALNAAIRDRLERLCARPIDFTLADVFVRPEDVSAADVDAFDLVVVGGGGSISNGERNARNGTTLPMALDEYRRARVPFAFVALGYNLFAGEDYRYAGELSELLAAAGERGDSFSVRNDGSLERLRLVLGGQAASVREVPDPGFFVDVTPKRPQEVGDRPYLVLQLAGDKPGLRFGDPAARTMTRVGHRRAQNERSRMRTGFVESMAELCRWVEERHGMDVLISPHVHGDMDLVASLSDRLYGQTGPGLSHRPFRVGGTPHPSNAASFFGAYETAELVVGMRGHSVICGVGLRRPVIAISSHPKVEAFMDACGLSQWSIDASTVDAEALCAAVDDLLGAGQADYLARRDEGVAGFEQRFDDFLVTALERVDGALGGDIPTRSRQPADR